MRSGAAAVCVALAIIVSDIVASTTPFTASTSYSSAQRHRGMGRCGTGGRQFSIGDGV